MPCLKINGNPRMNNICKVILLAGNFPPVFGGISEHLGLIAQNFPVILSVIGMPTRDWQSFDSQQKFYIKRLPLPESWGTSASKYKYLALYYYQELRKEKNYDYILCGEAHHTLMLPAWWVHTQTGIPFGVFTYGAEMLRHQKQVTRFLFNPLLCAAQNVFPDSQRAGEISKDIGVTPDKIHVVNPNVNIERLNGNIAPDVIQKKFGLQGKKCILSMGRLVERKGQDMMIRALPEILNKIPNVHYIIAGRGSYEVQLRKLAKDLSVESHITFTGYVSDDDLGSYYALCDVFAMISREIPEKGDIEGFGIVYLEANLFGKPVVAGRSGGVSDAVLDGQTGLMVDPDNPLDVANAVTRLLLDPALARQLGEAGRARVLEEFSGQSAVQKLHNAMAQRLH